MFRDGNRLTAWLPWNYRHPPHSVSVSLSSERVTDPQGQDMAGWIQSGRDAVAVLPSSVSVFVQSEGIDRHSGYL